MNLHQLKVRRLKGIRFDGRPPIWDLYLYAKSIAKQRQVLRVITVGQLVDKPVSCLFNGEAILLKGVENRTRKVFEVYKITMFRGHHSGILLCSISYLDVNKPQFLQLQGWK